MNIDLEHLAQLFEAENIDLDVLAEMTHEDMKSVGISTFGWRHKIIKAFALKKTQNVVETITAAPLFFLIFLYNLWQNLFDDIQVHVLTMSILDENHPAESTRIQIESMTEEEVLKS